ncbi:MAG: OmpA family protein [Pseudomonadota bacterium]
MKKVLLFGLLGFTAAVFYVALWHKSEAIEDDIRARVTNELAAIKQQNISIDVDGRHVTLSGVVHDAGRERHLLNVVDNTYGVLGPIDGLSLVVQNGFVSAVKSANGIVLAGTVPDEQTRTRLLDAAKLSTEGTVEDGLDLSGMKGKWHEEAGFGLDQLGLMSSGTMTAGAGAYLLSGTAKDNAQAIQSAVAKRGGWQAQVSGPDQTGDLTTRIAGLAGDLETAKTAVADRDETILGLRSQVSAMTGERDSQRLGFMTDLEAKDALLSERDARIAGLQAELETARLGASDEAISVSDLSARLAELKAERSALATELGTREATISDLKADLDLIQGSLSAEKSNNVQLSEQLTAAAKLASERQAELSALAASADEQSALLSDRENAIVKLQADLDVMRAGQSEDQANAVSLSEQLAALEADIKAKDGLVSDRDLSIASLNEDLSILRGQLTDGKANAVVLSEELAAAENLVLEKDAAIAALKAELASASAAASEEVQGLRDKLARESADREAALARATEIESQSKKDAAASTANRALIDDLTSQLSDRDKRIAILEAGLAEMDAEFSRSSSVLAERDAMIAALRAAPASDLQLERCTERTDSVIAGSRINFVTASAEISADSVPLLERLTGIAIACSGNSAVLEIGGHTDDRGEEADNQSLSEARAASVVTFMVDRGVPADGVNAVGYGETTPVADNATEEGRAANRRISFAWQGR